MSIGVRGEGAIRGAAFHELPRALPLRRGEGGRGGLRPRLAHLERRDRPQSGLNRPLRRHLGHDPTSVFLLNGIVFTSNGGARVRHLHVIVVGARCAGSPTAMLLARRGYRVLLVDRADFPSDTLSTHYIHQPGVAYLQRWGCCRRSSGPTAPRSVRRSSTLVPSFSRGHPRRQVTPPTPTVHGERSSTTSSSERRPRRAPSCV